MTNQTVVSLRGVTRRYESTAPPALDARTGERAADLLRELNQSGQTPVVTHDPRVARHCATRLITPRDGRSGVPR